MPVKFSRVILFKLSVSHCIFLNLGKAISTITRISIIRTSIIPSLLNTYEYNRDHNVKDISIYEIAKTYDVKYNEITKIAGLMTGSYVTSSWKKDLEVDFYIVKGICFFIFGLASGASPYTSHDKQF